MTLMTFDKQSQQHSNCRRIEVESVVTTA